MHTITRKNCWLLPRPRYVKMATASLSYKVLKKVVKPIISSKINSSFWRWTCPARNYIYIVHPWGICHIQDKPCLSMLLWSWRKTFLQELLESWRYWTSSWLNLPGSKIFILLACWCNQHMAVISKVLDDQHILTTIELFEVQSPFRCSTLDRKSRSRAQSLLPLPD